MQHVMPLNVQRTLTAVRENSAQMANAKKNNVKAMMLAIGKLGYAGILFAVAKMTPNAVMKGIAKTASVNVQTARQMRIVAVENAGNMFAAVKITLNAGMMGIARMVNVIVRNVKRMRNVMAEENAGIMFVAVRTMKNVAKI